MSNSAKIIPAIWFTKFEFEQNEAVILFTGMLILDRLSNIPETIAVIAIDNAEIIVAL